jgi:hypothetical protein
MADIKTHLRELSVGIPFFTKKDYYKPNDFLEFCENFIKGTTNLTLKKLCKNPHSFDQDELDIISRGVKLGRSIHKHIFNNQPVQTIIWAGLETQSGKAADLIIDDKIFSLKEESFILENMGLYNYLNIILNDKKYKRGIHCFEEFAPFELGQWFQATKDSIISNMLNEFSFIGAKYKSSAILLNDDLVMRFNDEEIILKNFSNYTYNGFKNDLNNKFKEKVFSKMVKKYCEGNNEYLNAKKLCAEQAGKGIENLLKNSIGTSPNVKNWFRIEDEEYYYCKVLTNNVINILKVPSKENFNSSIIVNNIETSVPKHQLNIITTLINTKNNATFKFRNECRYSHGQLNGTPESKCYYIDSANKLEFAYDRII